MNNLKLMTNSDTINLNSIINKYSYNAPYHTSIDIITTGVYNLFEGVVWYIGNEENNLFYICIRISDTQIFKYGHLKSVEFNELYGRIRPGELIGIASKYFTFEYLCELETIFPTYINGLKLYKNNPNDIVFNDFLPSISPSHSTYKNTSDSEYIILTDPI